MPDVVVASPGEELGGRKKLASPPETPAGVAVIAKASMLIS